MSEQGLNFQMVESFGNNERLSAFYDFGLNTTGVLGEVGDYTGVIRNSPYARDSSLHDCYVLASRDADSGNVETYVDAITGASHNLASGAFEIPLDGMDVNQTAMILDFEFSGDIQGGVLLGCYELGQEDLNGTVYTLSSGYNVGVTDRGHLFLECLNRDEEETVSVMYNAELSKRNIIGINTSKSAITLSYFDYLNKLSKSIMVPVRNSLVSNTGSILLGGTNTFFKSNPIFSGNLNSFTLLSGDFDSAILKEIGEGVLGDYTYTPEVSNSYTRVTGYTETITYRTGITGYEYDVTGTLTIHTGRETFTGSFSSDGQPTDSVTEGDRYYKYYTVNNGITETFYKEEIGFLNPDSGYNYYPTGEDAYDTLGLNDISSSIQTYAETTGLSRRGDTELTINLYGKTPMTGVLNEVSGIVETALEETYTIVTPASSGITFQGVAEDLKKNYIYYMGDR